MNSAEHPGDLEAELRALGASLDVPAPPADQVAAAVRGRLQDEHSGARAPGKRARRWKIVVAVVLAVAAATAATPQGREAVVAVLRLAGVELRLGSTAPAPVVTPATPPGERTMAPDDVRTGYPTALGTPERVTVNDGGRVVSMFWPGGIRFDRIDGAMYPYFFKTLGPPFPEQVEVDGVTGWWVSGEHPLGYLTRDGGAEIPLRQAASTLVWQSGTTGYRLEGTGSVARAVELARSLR
ncbi:hypothetical protein [Nonomuraea sp. SBT364]|uniref:hypothetical protein n=1 Tax=Nonomuraea sp. SBT364 TaxID=1580530 RepID=UPI00066E3843|nr:hypothetical protein [Nonomuraea sp. SBT364]